MITIDITCHDCGHRVDNVDFDNDTEAFGQCVTKLTDITCYMGTGRVRCPDCEEDFKREKEEKQQEEFDKELAGLNADYRKDSGV